MEIEGPQSDLAVRSNGGELLLSEQNLGNPISSSSGELTQQQSPSRKRKYPIDEASVIDADQPALKVLHVEHQNQVGYESNNGAQSAWIIDSQLAAGDGSAAIEDKETFVTPHQSALEALLVAQDDYNNNDSLSALRGYSGADDSPASADEYSNVSFTDALRPALEGLEHIQARAEFRVMDPQSELEAQRVVGIPAEDETNVAVSDLQSELEAPSLQNLVNVDTEVSIGRQSELEGPHVMQNVAEDGRQLCGSDPQADLESWTRETELAVHDPRSEIESWSRERVSELGVHGAQPELEDPLVDLKCRQEDTEMRSQKPQVRLETLSVEGRDARPPLQPLLVTECDPKQQLEPLQVEDSDPRPRLEPLTVEEIYPQPQLEPLTMEEIDPRAELESVYAEESVARPGLGALHIEGSDQPEFEALHMTARGENEARMRVSDPESKLQVLNDVESAEAVVGVTGPQTELETLPVVQQCGQSETKMLVTDALSGLEDLPVMEDIGGHEIEVGINDPLAGPQPVHGVETAAGESSGAKVERMNILSELDLKSMEGVRNSAEDDPQAAARKKKLILLAAVAAFFSTLAGALGSIGELIAQLEQTAMPRVPEDSDGHLERTGTAQTASTSAPYLPSESSALRLHSAMSRSSSSLRNNIVVSMFLLMQQHRKRTQKRPRELTGPWYIKPRSSQAFEPFPDFSPQGDPEKFRELFRISPSLFFYICEMVRTEMLSDTPRSLRVLPNRVLTVERQVAIAIRRLATGNQFLGIADSFGVSKSTAVKVTWKFVVAFIKKARPLHLQWPSTEQMRQIKAGFKHQWGFPNCCGVVDGTHFTVEFPKGEDVAQYYDHQNHVSISMQAIVGHDQRFLDVVVGWPGSIQEYQLLQNTNFFRNVANTKERLNGDPYITQDGSSLREYILGDSGYPLYDWLMVPYPTGLSAAKDEWNSRHAVAKQCVEDALVRLKGTWRILSRILWKPRKERIGKMVFACCLLHNMIIEQQDGLNPQVYAGVNPHPGGYTGVSIPTEEVFEGGPEAREVLFREVMGGGIV